MGDKPKSEQTILVVEDDNILGILTLKQLATLGFLGEIASDGAEAIKKVNQNDYHLILMDIAMPNMDGFETTKVIRELEQEKQKTHIPIIGMTASPKREPCITAGMDDFVMKPLLLDQLKNLLSHWLQ